MARLLGRLRGRPRPDLPPAQVPPAPATPPGALRRERRTLIRVREERIRDLGGLALEMVRRSRFRQDLLVEQCNEVLVLEERIRTIDDLLRRAAGARRHLRSPRCECGAPIQWGSHFCGNCGRPTGAPVVTCTRCGNALPADARYCASCGAIAAETARSEHVAASYEQTAHGEQFWPEAREDGDPWER
jgi:hypothetical protein